MALPPSPPAPAKKLLDFLASYEAPGGYGVVYANRQSRLPKPLTSMTINEVIADGPRRAKDRTNGVKGSSAAGRYQFMQDTLLGLKRSLGLSGNELMTPDTQDRLGYQLLLQRGYKRYMAGSLSLAGFGNQIAMEWASFPVLSSVNGKARGQSYYDGDGQNSALVGAPAVEAVLRSMRASPIVSVADADLVSEVAAPRVETATATATDTLPWWARLLGRKGAPPISRPGLHPKGNPELYDVQKALRDRAYYTKGKLDGLDGPLTQEAVAQARKDNGLGDGGVDTDFLTAMSSFPQRPVAAERLTMTLGDAAKQRPEVFSPVKWLGSLGVGAIGLGGANGSGLMDNLQSTASKANDVFGTVQTVFGFAGSVIGFVVEHRTVFLIGLGLVLVWKALSVALDAWIKVRRAFF